MKNTQSKIKPMKAGKEFQTTFSLGCKYFTHNFKLQEVKMTNKILIENLIVCRSNQSRFFKQKHNNKK